MPVPQRTTDEVVANLIVLGSFVGQRECQQEAVLVAVHELAVNSIIPIGVYEPSPFHHICMTPPVRFSIWVKAINMSHT